MVSALASGLSLLLAALSGVGAQPGARKKLHVRVSLGRRSREQWGLGQSGALPPGKVTAQQVAAKTRVSKHFSKGPESKYWFCGTCTVSVT